jgi:hypothetical protein
MPIDVHKLIGEIAARNQCRVEEWDPIFAVSTMNRMLMDEALGEMLRQIGVVVAEFEVTVRGVESHAVKLIRDVVAESAAAWRAEIAKDINGAHLRSRELVDDVNRAHSAPAILRGIELGLFAAIFLVGLGELLGLCVR